MIQLDEDLVVGDWVVPSMFLSDGCTMPRFLRWLLNAKRFRDECILHDFLRRHLVHYNLVTVKHADEILKKYVRKKSNYLYSRIYWLGVRIGRESNSHTEPFPLLDWRDYTKPQSDIWKRLTKKG